MATIDEAINTIITNATAQADKYLGLADTAVSSALSAAGSYAYPGSALADFTPEAIEPDIPTVGDTSLLYEANLADLVALLSTQLAQYYATYYPLTNDAYDEATVWLVNTITVGGTGLSPTVEDQIWQRGRTRVITEGSRIQSQTVNDFAGRGYILPPGALNGALKELRSEQYGKINDFAAQVAIKQAEIEIDNIKFAVDLAMKTRISAMGAANDYIRGIMSAPDAAAKVAAMNGDAQARMMSATADLYRARLTRDELVLRASDSDQATALASSKLNIDAFYKGIDNKVSASNAAAATYGQNAAAALGQIQAVASAGQSLF